MRQIYLQKQFYQLAKRLPTKIIAQAQMRLGLISAWQALRAKGIKAGQAVEILGISRATLYRWDHRLQQEGPKGLEERSRLPKRMRQRQWGLKEITLIQELREIYPRWGKEKLAILARREGVILSVSTTGRILKRVSEKLCKWVILKDKKERKNP